MQEDQKLTKKEKKELRKLEWQEKAKVTERKENIKKYSIWAGTVAVIVLVIAGLIMLVNSPSSTTTNEKANVAPVSEKDITKGENKAKVTLIEYSDFQCPACAVYYPLTKQLMTDFGDKIYFVYRFFPLRQIHKNAGISSQAAYAANLQGKFWEMHDILFENQNSWSTLPNPQDEFLTYAKKISLDVNKFKADLNSDETKKFVSDEENQGISEGINSTPTFFINGVKIQNPQNYEEFKKIIDDELNKK